MNISMIGLDTANTVFQIHGVDETGRADETETMAERSDRAL
jgi:hypothetical protein